MSIQAISELAGWDRKTIRKEYSLRKSSCGPGKRGVLDQHPGVAPASSLKLLQSMKCVRPAAEHVPLDHIDVPRQRLRRGKK